MKEIDSQILKGIREALASVNSPHVSVIDRVTSQSPSNPALRRRGAPIHPNYEIKVSENEGSEILKSLAEIETKLGYSTIFADRQINLLRTEWIRAIDQ